MPTGDGLLARLIPTAPIPLQDLIALCDASQAYGNGVVEVTQRGNLQIRGLSVDSAPLFARAAAALEFGIESRPVVLGSPLLGLDSEGRDLRVLLAALRTRLSCMDSSPLAPKVSVVVDGGGALHLDDVPADIRLRAGRASRLHLSVAGDPSAAASLGWLEPDRAVDAIIEVLAAIANRGVEARGRDLANDIDMHTLRASLAGILTAEAPPPPRPRAEPMGTFHLSNGLEARGIGLAFGHVEANVLRRLIHEAAEGGAASIRPAPGRALLVIGLTAAAAKKLAAAAGADGWVVRRDDVRRHVVACAGAPACASATLSTRRLAPIVARAASSLLDGFITIHVSGCPKGCAHPGAAALTLVGPDRLVVEGRACDPPQGRISAEDFVAGLGRLRAQGSGIAHERSADTIARLGARRVIESLGGEFAHD